MRAVEIDETDDSHSEEETDKSCCSRKGGPFVEWTFQGEGEEGSECQCAEDERYLVGRRGKEDAVGLQRSKGDVLVGLVVLGEGKQRAQS